MLVVMGGLNPRPTDHESAYKAVSDLFELFGNVSDAAFRFASGPARRQLPYR